jgi:hypothetical protein
MSTRKILDDSVVSSSSGKSESVLSSEGKSGDASCALNALQVSQISSTCAYPCLSCVCTTLLESGAFLVVQWC